MNDELRERLTWWGKEAAAATRVRNSAIQEARAAGASYREIGEAVGLSHSAVAKILHAQHGEASG